MTGEKVTESAKLLWRASILIKEAAEGLESAGAPSSAEREWLARYEALVSERRGRGGRRE